MAKKPAKPARKSPAKPKTKPGSKAASRTARTRKTAAKSPAAKSSRPAFPQTCAAEGQAGCPWRKAGHKKGGDGQIQGQGRKVVAETQSGSQISRQGGQADCHEAS